MSNGKNVLILGASSDLAAALAVQFALQKYTVTIAGRDVAKLHVMASDLKIKYAIPVYPVKFDALDFNSHSQFYNNLEVKPDVAICVFGLLGDQQKAQDDWSQAALILNSNFNGAVSILNVIANAFEKNRSGVIVGISSVAGERGRQSNYLYGSAKAGFTAYLSGLRNRLFKSNVHVMTVKPGFMQTRMTEGMKTPKPLTAAPEAAGKRIFKATQAKKNVVYVLPVWKWVMLIIRNIPEGIFKKLRL